jgi:hypothetical protein
MRRTHLRTRVLLLTGAFALALFAIAFGLSWRAKQSQERWTRLIAVETKAAATLEELIRAQNAFHARQEPVERYRLVEQLLNDESLRAIDIRALRGRAFASCAPTSPRGWSSKRPGTSSPPASGRSAISCRSSSATRAR